MDRSVLKRQIFFFLMTIIVNNCSSLNVTSDNFDEEFERANPFQYSYAVKAEANDSSLVDQSKREFSNGNDVIGQYKVLLPDGRLQTVTYTSGEDGFRAEVQYTQTNIVRTLLNNRPIANNPSTASTATTTTTPTTSAKSQSIAPSADAAAAATLPPLQPHQEEALRTRTKSRSRLRHRTWDERDLPFSTSAEETSSIPSNPNTPAATEPALTVIDVPRTAVASASTSASGSGDATTSIRRSSSSSSPSTWTFDKIREKLSSKDFKFL